MTNKLKKEIENYFNGIYTSNRYWVMDNRRISDKKFQDILNCIEKDIFKFLKQAKLSQKQEDDERFEELIKRLKKSICLGDWDVVGKDDCVMCKTVDEVAGELKENKNNEKRKH